MTLEEYQTELIKKTFSRLLPLYDFIDENRKALVALDPDKNHEFLTYSPIQPDYVFAWYVAAQCAHTAGYTYDSICIARDIPGQEGVVRNVKSGIHHAIIRVIGKLFNSSWYNEEWSSTWPYSQEFRDYPSMGFHDTARIQAENLADVDLAAGTNDRIVRYLRNKYIGDIAKAADPRDIAINRLIDDLGN